MPHDTAMQALSRLVGEVRRHRELEDELEEALAAAEAQLAVWSLLKAEPQGARMKKTLLDAEKTSPDDVKDGDWFPAKVVAVAGSAEDWALYIGPSDWTDEMVRSSGNKLPGGIVPFWYQMQRRTYRD